MTSTPLTGDPSIGTWLDHPVGGPIIRDLLAQAGQDPDVLRPVRRLAIKRLVKLSRGSFTTEMLDELVRRAEAGYVPPPAVAGRSESASDAGATATGTSASTALVERPEWVEQITPGRFTGKTVIVTGARKPRSSASQATLPTRRSPTRSSAPRQVRSMPWRTSPGSWTT